MQTPKSFKTPFLSLSTWSALSRGRIPGQVVIQFTDRCNATCVQCGMRTTNSFERKTMAVDDVKRLLDSMAQKGVHAVSFTGGEPLMYLDEICELMTYAGNVGIRYIRTGTNGFIFRGSEKPDFKDKLRRTAEKLAKTPVRNFWVSVDSANAQAHEENRGLKGVMQGMEKGLSVFEEFGIHPSANLGINRCTGALPIASPQPDNKADQERFENDFRNAFRLFFRTVSDMGFSLVNSCYPMSFEEDEADSSAVYAATSTDDFIRFSKQEKTLLFRALLDVIPEFRDSIRIFTPRSSLLALIRQYEENYEFPPYPCRGGQDFFFIDSRDMNTYPCGYRGQENLGSFTDINIDALQDRTNCTLCDWECFRDPSELAGPLMDILRNPIQLAKRFYADRQYTRLWFEDLRYNMACDFFDARKPINRKALKRFRKTD